MSWVSFHSPLMRILVAVDICKVWIVFGTVLLGAKKVCRSIHVLLLQAKLGRNAHAIARICTYIVSKL